MHTIKDPNDFNRLRRDVRIHGMLAGCKMRDTTERELRIVARIQRMRLAKKGGK